MSQPSGTARPASSVQRAGATVCALVLVATAACGSETVPAAGSSPAATPTAAGAPPTSDAVLPILSSAPAAGTTLLASLPTDGRVSVIAGPGAGFSVLDSRTVQDQDQSVMAVYDPAGHLLTTLPAGSLTGECGAADLTVHGRRLVVTALVTVAPAQGIDPARYSLDLVARDASSGSQVWKTNLIAAKKSSFSCSDDDGRLLGAGYPMTFTTDSASGVVHLTNGDDEFFDGVIDMATGRIDPRKDAYRALGNVVVLDPHYDDNSFPDHEVALAVPPDFAPQGKLPTTLSSPAVGVILKYLGSTATGVFDVTSAGSSPYGGVSDDGNELFAYEDDPSGSKIVAYRLPSGAQLWSIPRLKQAVDLQLVAEGGGVLVGLEKDLSHRSGTMVGIDASTGKQQWSLPGFDVCGITRTQMLVAANGQLAVIDLAEGKQLAFTGATGQQQSCPPMLAGGIEVDPGGPIVQALTR